MFEKSQNQEAKEKGLDSLFDIYIEEEMNDKIAKEYAIIEEFVSDPMQVDSSGSLGPRRTIDDLYNEGK